MHLPPPVPHRGHPGERGDFLCAAILANALAPLVAEFWGLVSAMSGNDNGTGLLLEEDLSAESRLHQLVRDGEEVGARFGDILRTMRFADILRTERVADALAIARRHYAALRRGEDPALPRVEWATCDACGDDRVPPMEFGRCRTCGELVCPACWLVFSKTCKGCSPAYRGLACGSAPTRNHARGAR